MVKWSPKPESSGFLPVAKDHTALSATWVREAEPPGPLWY